jgi:hypothetical protein
MGPIDRAKFTLTRVVLDQGFGLLVENPQSLTDGRIVVVGSSVGFGSLEKPRDENLVGNLQL